MGLLWYIIPHYQDFVKRLFFKEFVNWLGSLILCVLQGFCERINNLLSEISAHYCMIVLIQQYNNTRR